MRQIILKGLTAQGLRATLARTDKRFVAECDGRTLALPAEWSFGQALRFLDTLTRETWPCA